MTELHVTLGFRRLYIMGGNYMYDKMAYTGTCNSHECIDMGY